VVARLGVAREGVVHLRAARLEDLAAGRALEAQRRHRRQVAHAKRRTQAERRLGRDAGAPLRACLPRGLPTRATPPARHGRIRPFSGAPRDGRPISRSTASAAGAGSFTACALGGAQRSGARQAARGLGLLHLGLRLVGEGARRGGDAERGDEEGEDDSEAHVHFS
jgi:hypothetical protein